MGLFTLLEELATDPKAGLRRAMEPEFFWVTTGLAATTALGLVLVFGKAKGTYEAAAAYAMICLVSLVVPVHVGGLLSGGSGDAREALQLCSLAFCPITVARFVLLLTPAGFLAWPLEWLAIYHLMRIAHGFREFRDMLFGLFVAAGLWSILSFVGFMFVLAKIWV